MYQAPEQLMAWNSSNLQASAQFVSIAMDSAKRVFELNMKTAKSAWTDGIEQSKALAAIKDAKELAQIKANAFQPDTEKLASYFKGVFDVASATQLEMGKLLEERVSDFNKHVVSGLDSLMKSAPAGSEVAVAAVKSAIAAANNAYDNATKSAKQFAQMAQANVDAATNGYSHAGKKKSS